ncbi:MAG: hypothetical protein LLG05_12720 [Porphyromonadaceae bacterium]|nr:hypothetical protein [Porphyromonadaceae bacterium]
MSYFPIELDKARNLLLGFEALQLFKKMTGKSLAKLDYENEDFEDFIPTMIYCGLVHEDKELTLEETTRLIDKYLGIKGAIEMLPSILAETFGKQEIEKNVQRAAENK